MSSKRCSHARHQHFLVVRPVEDADPPAFGQALHAAPHEVVLQLLLRRRLEAVDLRGLGIESAEDVLDRAVLAGAVHRLKDEEDRPAALRVEQVGELEQLVHRLREHLP
jgi:hypothetical protein